MYRGPETLHNFHLLQFYSPRIPHPGYTAPAQAYQPLIAPYTKAMMAPEVYLLHSTSDGQLQPLSPSGPVHNGSGIIGGGRDGGGGSACWFWSVINMSFWINERDNLSVLLLILIIPHSNMNVRLNEGIFFLHICIFIQESDTLGLHLERPYMLILCVR